MKTGRIRFALDETQGIVVVRLHGAIKGKAFLDSLMPDFAPRQSYGVMIM